jgi:DNA mismatch repair protein MutS
MKHTNVVGVTAAMPGGTGIDKLIETIAHIDVAISTAKAVTTMNLTRPIIVDDDLYEVIGLRHPIIEANEQSGIYVPNDIYLGDETNTKHNHITLTASGGARVNGVLLYGINSSGKSSLTVTDSNVTSPVLLTT